MSTDLIDMPQQCTAKSKQTHQRCKRFVTPGSHVCHYHGGKTPKGVALPQTKHGKYSKYLPGDLLETYHETIQDADLPNLRPDIALVEARLGDLLQRVDSGESGVIWRELGGCATRIQKAQRRGDHATVNQWMQELISLVKQGHDDYAAWNNVNQVIDQRRKLIKSEYKRQVEMQQYITVENVMAIVAGLADSCRRQVKDPKALAAISADIAQIIGAGTQSLTPQTNSPSSLVNTPAEMG